MLYTRLRTAVNNEFEKDFFNLMNSSVFGKVIQNIRKYKDMNLVTKYAKFMMKPNINFFQDGSFRDYSRIVGAKRPPL